MNTYLTVGQETLDRRKTLNHSNYSRHTLFVEAAGNAPLVSLNYDFLIPTKREKLKYSLALGLTHHFTDALDFVAAPQVNLLYGRSFMAEFGLGYTQPLSFVDNGVGVIRLGGRYQKRAGGMFYRLAFISVIAPQSDQVLLPGFGAGIGYTFRLKYYNSQ